MSSRRTELSRRAVRWLLPAAALALTPKCLLCVLAYVGLGAALGLGPPEFCGATANASPTWVSSLAWLGLAFALGALWISCQLPTPPNCSASSTRKPPAARTRALIVERF